MDENTKMPGNDRESRRGARIAASFWIGIEGLDVQPVLRQGNLSASGLYFEVSQSAGPVGSVQFLHLESKDRQVIVQVLARIIRVTEVDCLVNGKSLGLAMEFLPASIKGRDNLRRLVRHVVEVGLRQEESVDHSFAAELSAEGAGTGKDRTTLQHLSVKKVVLETDWQAMVGDLLQVQIKAPNAASGRLPLDGQVTKVEQLGSPSQDPGYRVEVRVTGIAKTDQIIKPPADQDTVDVLTELLTESLDEFSLPARDHLSGLLSRIKLPTLLGLMEMERLSGELRFTSDDLYQEVVLFLQEGRLLDVESKPKTGHDARSSLSHLMLWNSGQFHFEVKTVDREDKVQSSMTSLLLDLAREEDEATVEAAPAGEDRDFF
jgi:hypothetical protein